MANDAYVVTALGRACTLPRDKEKLKKMDDITLTVSAMQSAILVSSLKKLPSV